MTQNEQPTVYALRAPLYATIRSEGENKFIQLPAGVQFVIENEIEGDARIRLTKAGSLSASRVFVEARHWTAARYERPVTVRAKSGNLYYGGPAYPIHESKLPEVDFEEILTATKAAIKRASNFEARGPVVIECRIAGDGWDVTYEYGIDELVAAAAAEREAGQ